PHQQGKARLGDLGHRPGPRVQVDPRLLVEPAKGVVKGADTQALTGRTEQAVQLRPGTIFTGACRPGRQGRAEGRAGVGHKVWTGWGDRRRLLLVEVLEAALEVSAGRADAGQDRGDGATQGLQAGLDLPGHDKQLADLDLTRFQDADEILEHLLWI